MSSPVHVLAGGPGGVPDLMSQRVLAKFAGCSRWQVRRLGPMVRSVSGLPAEWEGWTAQEAVAVAVAAYTAAARGGEDNVPATPSDEDVLAVVLDALRDERTARKGRVLLVDHRIEVSVNKDLAKARAVGDDPMVMLPLGPLLDRARALAAGDQSPVTRSTKSHSPETATHNQATTEPQQQPEDAAMSP